MDKLQCIGCYNDFYNGNNNLGVEECWSFADARVITRFRISTCVPTNIRSAWVKVRFPNCYRQTGYYYADKLPDYVGKQPAQQKSGDAK